MGIAQDNLEPEVVEKILAFETVIGRLAKLEVQRVVGQDYPVLEDALLVLKRRRALEAMAGPVVGRPLPAKFAASGGGEDTSRSRLRTSRLGPSGRHGSWPR